MIHSLLLSFALALAPQAGPSHADLHPAQADVFVELGDLGTLLPALDKAPASRFMHDERLKSITQAAGVAATGSLKDFVKELLRNALPSANPDAWLDGAKTFSLSFTGLGTSSDTVAPVSFLAVADLSTPEQAQTLRDAIVANTPKHEPMSCAVAGVERLHTGDKAAEDLWCVAIGARVVVGGSADKPEDFVARAEKKQPGLSSRDTFKKQLASLDKASGTPVLWFALARPIDQIVADMKDDGPGEEQMKVLREFPAELNPFSSARVARMQIVGDRFVTEFVSSDEAPGKPVDLAWLEPVPSTAMLVYSTAFDGGAMSKRVRALVSKNEQGAATLAALEQKLGFGPEKLLAHLGPGLTLYIGPITGIGLDLRLWIDCDDATAFASELETLMGTMGETLPGFVVKTKPYKLKKSGSEEKIEVPITTLTLPEQFQPMPMLQLSPSFAPVGKKLVFGLNSMDVKNELKRVHSGEGEPIVAGANPLTALGFSVPADARSVFVMDWAKLFGGLLTTFKQLAPMMGNQIPFDLAKLPPPELFTEYFKPSFQYSKSIPGGLYRRHEASFGPETWFRVIGKAAGQGMGGAMPARATAVPPSKPAGK